jgi:Ribbon-helix-helix protein, copG family
MRPLTPGQPAPKINWRTTPDRLDRVDQLARERGVTRSELIRVLLDDALDREAATV